MAGVDTGGSQACNGGLQVAGSWDGGAAVVSQEQVCVVVTVRMHEVVLHSGSAGTDVAGVQEMREVGQTKAALGDGQRDGEAGVLRQGLPYILRFPSHWLEWRGRLMPRAIGGGCARGPT